MAETDPSQQYCVRWNSHLCSLSTAFPQLLDQEKFVDVTLACEGQQVHCHKVVLAACSQYFDNLLSENPCKHPIIILPSDIKLWTIQALVEFMYKGQVNVSQAGLPDLVKSGDLLQIRGLCNTDIGLSVENGSEVSKVPTNATTTSPAASVRKESERVSEDQESTIKTETYDLEDEEVTDDPKNPDYAMANVTVEYDDERRADSMNDGTMDGYDGMESGSRRIRRPEATLQEAAQCVSRGETFQRVSTMFGIPISTIRFYMARKGILPRRKRGRTTITPATPGNGISSAYLEMATGNMQSSPQNAENNSQSPDFNNSQRSLSTSPPLEPPYHFANFKLPELRPKLV
ncbi:protein abrupt-like isoform X3 [Culicoides brevitarsis]|uniref:protein abrupt-like isoform X3 n=1 Tax=Culicoides brevitarsis TaxID=469753 RepID=UPI00307B71BB